MAEIDLAVAPFQANWRDHFRSVRARLNGVPAAGPTKAPETKTRVKVRLVPGRVSAFCSARPPSIDAHRTIDAVLRATAAEFKMSPRELCSARRSKEVVRPRQIAMYLARETTTASLPMIGRFIGRRDPTTVFHALGRIASLALVDPTLVAEIGRVRARLETEEVAHG